MQTDSPAGRSHDSVMPPPPGGHGHSHSQPLPASAHTRRAVTAVIVPAIAATVVALVALWPGTVPPPPAGDGDGGQRSYGEVTQIVEEPCPTEEAPVDQPGRRCGTVGIRLTDGPGSGQTVTAALPDGPGAPRLRAGDEVVVMSDATGYTVVDHQRGRPLLLLLALVATVVVAFGRWRGLTALAGLVVSFAVLLLFVVPAILTGESPLLVAVVGAAAIMFAVLYLTHGVTVHTSVAVLGTLASLVLTGLLGAGFVALTHLTGIGEEGLYLSVLGGDVDMRGLLLAGIIIGSLGVLDDVTVTQAATVAELSRSALSRRQLYQAAVRVGRAHVASAVNTIVLAYAGASLPLLLLLAAGGSDVSDLLTGEFLAQEVVRSAVGTIGLVASVPLTTALAVLAAEPRVAVTAQRPRGRHTRR